MPDAAAFPVARPAGLARRPITVPRTYWRLDSSAPDAWGWEGFATPRYRFDPTSGRFRTRYAASVDFGAARERYAATGRVIPAADLGDHLVRLTTTRVLRVLDLRTTKTQDLLGVDDQISTSREPHIFAACQGLADTCRGWWDDGLDGIVYRSRTTAQESSNVAFWSLDGFEVASMPLGEAGAFLDELILRHRFTIA